MRDHQARFLSGNDNPDCYKPTGHSKRCEMHESEAADMVFHHHFVH
jgi:hypothetical protein